MNTGSGFVWSPPHGGLRSDRIQFPGYAPATPAAAVEVAPGAARWLELNADDLLQIRCQVGAAVVLAVVEAARPVSAELLGIEPSVVATPPKNRFHAQEIEQRLGNRGLAVDDLEFTRLADLSEAIALRIPRRLSLIVINPESAENLVFGDSAGSVFLEIKPAGDAAIELPEPLGVVRDEFTISRGTARAYELHRGEFVQVIDVEGRQCSDFMALNSARLLDDARMPAEVSTRL